MTRQELFAFAGIILMLVPLTSCAPKYITRATMASDAANPVRVVALQQTPAFQVGTMVGFGLVSDVAQMALRRGLPDPRLYLAAVRDSFASRAVSQIAGWRHLHNDSQLVHKLSIVDTGIVVQFRLLEIAIGKAWGFHAKMSVSVFARGSVLTGDYVLLEKTLLYDSRRHGRNLGVDELRAVDCKLLKEEMAVAAEYMAAASVQFITNAK